MRCQLLTIVLVFLIVLCVCSLSGCLNDDSNQTPNQNQTIDGENNELDDMTNHTDSTVRLNDDVEIHDYQVMTTWITGCCGDFENHTKPGFYHQLPLWSNASYQIQGNITNIGDDELVLIRVNISFCDVNGSVLFDLHDLNKSIIIQHLSPGFSKRFVVDMYVGDYYYFNDSISFDDAFMVFHRVESLRFSVDSMYRG